MKMGKGEVTFCIAPGIAALTEGGLCEGVLKTDALVAGGPDTLVAGPSLFAAGIQAASCSAGPLCSNSINRGKWLRGK